MEIEKILENSNFICMLNQAAGDREILGERLNLSSEQLKPHLAKDCCSLKM